MSDDLKKQPFTIPFSTLADDDFNDSDDELILDQLAEATNDTINETSPPSVLGEQSVSGDMPDPESDDDTMANMQQVGLNRSNYDDQQPLNIAKSVEEAEKMHRNS